MTELNYAKSVYGVVRTDQHGEFFKLCRHPRQGQQNPIDLPLR
jgi:hypothetical protein